MNDWEPDFDPDELADLVVGVAAGVMDKAALMDSMKSAIVVPHFSGG